MLDIFGKEANRGDIISSCKVSRSNGFSLYMNAQLGVILNVLPYRKWKRGSWEYNRVFNKLHNSLSSAQSAVAYAFGGQPPAKKIPTATDPEYYPVCEKITFIPFDLNFTGVSPKLTKNGTPIARPQLSSNFMLVDKSSLNAEWLEVYERVLTVYKI